MKKPEEYLDVRRNQAASVIGGVIMLRTKSSTDCFSVVGVSKGLKLSMPIEACSLMSSVMISTEGMRTGRDEMIALTLKTPSIFDAAYSYMIRVTLKDGVEPYVHLDEYWVPLAPVHATNNGFLSVSIGDKYFCTDPKRIEKCRYVSDATILCEYVLGRISDEEVMAAAQEVVEEKSAREELSELRKELKEALSRLQDREDHVVELVHKLDDAKVELKNLQKNRDGVMDSYTDLRKVIEEIVSSYNNTFWNRTKSLSDIWKVLNNTASVHEYIDRERVINGDSWLVSKGIKIE